MHYVLVLLAVVSAMIFVDVAQANEEDISSDVADGRHRLDLTFVDLTTFDVNMNIDVLMLGYTRAFDSSIRVGVQTGILFVSDSLGPNSGANQKTTERFVADTLLTFQYDLSERMTASPWIPKTMGLNAHLTVPTGNADEALGIDSWLLSVGSGWAGNPFRDLWLVPGLGYEFTFAEGDRAIPVSRAYATLPVIWASPSGFWIGYGLTLFRDYEADQWLDDHSLIVGKMFRNGIGFSLDYSDLDRAGPISIPDDAQLFVNIYYQFGN